MSDKRKLHKFQWIRHPDYYRVAKSNYRVIEALKRQHDALQLTLESKEISDQDVNRLAEKNNAIGEHALIVVVFSAFTLEAYITNHSFSDLSLKEGTEVLSSFKTKSVHVIQGAMSSAVEPHWTKVER